jgi:hypothetical protein
MPTHGAYGTARGGCLLPRAPQLFRALDCARLQDWPTSLVTGQSLGSGPGGELDTSRPMLSFV